jgi:glycosyltransferase involved in cell wall biosynthesis
VNVAFLVNDLQLSGGVGVVLQHARFLGTLDRWDVSIVLVREPEEMSWSGYEHLPGLHVCSRSQALQSRYDVAIATWWETTFTLFEMTADRYVYFVQSLEDRFYRHDEAERFGAALTLDLPVSFITEATWIAETLAGLRPEATCHLVRNGVDKDVFTPQAQVQGSVEDPLKVLVEGSPSSWFKHVHAAIGAVNDMHEPHHLTVVTGDRQALGEVDADLVLGPLSHVEMAQAYARSDVILKLSSVEGMFGPPLEGFHCGATCVVTPVTGHEEYVVHGLNGLLTDWDDLHGTARQLDLLARDRDLLHTLRSNALETARAWPSWEESSRQMAAALAAIRSEPPPSGALPAARLLADLRGALEVSGMYMRERAELLGRLERLRRRLRRIASMPPFRWLLRLRHNRIFTLVTRPLRPIVRRLRRLLA